jgi:hypothetical protein
MKRTPIIRRTPLRRSSLALRTFGPKQIRAKVKRKPPAPWIMIYPDGREVLNLDTKQGMQEYRNRVGLMLIRQGGRCCLVDFIGACFGPLQFEAAQFEHENGRGMGGAHRDDRIVLPDGTRQNGAACPHCNTAKGSRRINYNH